MRILYLTTARIPGPRAHSIQIVRVCEALARLGCNVHLLAARRTEWSQKRWSSTSFGDFYGFKQSFSIIRIPTVDLMPIRRERIRVERLLFLITCLSYFIFTLPLALFFSILTPKEKKIMYIREPLLLNLFVVSKLLHRLPILYEVHHPLTIKKHKEAYANFLNNVDIFITISHELKEEIASLGIPNSKIYVAHSAVDIKQFDDVKESCEELRRRLNIPLNSYVALFVGHLYAEKKVEYLIDAVGLIEKRLSNFMLYVVGLGNLKKLRGYAKKRGVKGVDFIGGVPPVKVKEYMKAADVLLLRSVGYSPVTLFEYMAAKKPIVALITPSVSEVIKDGYNGLLYDDTTELVNAVIRLAEEPKLAAKLASNAYDEVRSKYTHEMRGKILINAMKEISS